MIRENNIARAKIRTAERATTPETSAFVENGYPLTFDTITTASEAGNLFASVKDLESFPVKIGETESIHQSEYFKLRDDDGTLSD